MRWWHRRKGHTVTLVDQWWDSHSMAHFERHRCSCGKRWTLMGEEGRL